MGVNDTTRVKLSEHDLAERAGIMAAKVKSIEHLRAKKRDDAKSTQALIDSELDLLAKMAEAVIIAEEDAKQGDLFADGTLAGVAQGIAERCTCDGGPEAEIKSPACPVHGVDSPAAVAAREARDARVADGADEALAEELGANANVDTNRAEPVEAEDDSDERDAAEVEQRLAEHAAALETPVGEQVDGGDEAA